MTDDRSAKKAARARMATTGEPYSTARRAVQTRPDRPAPLARPPAIDPREHAVHSRRWGMLACYLVRYEGRYSAWITGADPGDRRQAYGMPSEAAGRAFTDGWQATNLLHAPWDERIATISLLSPDTRNGILMTLRWCTSRTAESGWPASMTQSTTGARARWANSGIWAKPSDSSPLSPSGPPASSPARRPSPSRIFSPGSCATGRQQSVPTPRGPRWAMPSAATSPGPTAATAWARCGQDWAWPQRPVVRPPGARLPDTPATTLATCTVGGHRFDVVSLPGTCPLRCARP